MVDVVDFFFPFFLFWKSLPAQTFSFFFSFLSIWQEVMSSSVVVLLKLIKFLLHSVVAESGLLLPCMVRWRSFATATHPTEPRLTLLIKPCACLRCDVNTRYIDKKSPVDRERAIIDKTLIRVKFLFDVTLQRAGRHKEQRRGSVSPKPPSLETCALILKSYFFPKWLLWKLIVEASCEALLPALSIWFDASEQFWRHF